MKGTRPEPSSFWSETWRGHPSAPLRLVSGVFGLLMVLDLASMVALESLLPPEPRLLWHVVATWCLGLLLLPVFYFLVLRPMALQIRMRARAEQELRELYRNLELQVEERTAALRAANEELEARIRDVSIAREEAHFQSVLLDAAQEVIVATDLEGRLTYWNRFAATVLDLGPESRGRMPEEVGIEGLDVCRAVELLCSMGGGKSWTGETEIRSRTGPPFSALATCSPVCNPSGELIGLIAVASDLTERKRAEEALRASEHLYSTVVENSLTGIFISVEGKIIFANQEFARMLGRSPEELEGTPSLDIIHPDDRAKVLRVRELRASGVSSADSFEVRCRTKSGVYLWVASSNVQIEYKGRTALLCNLADITDQKRAEAELLESEAQLRILSASLIEAQESERARIARDLHDGIGQTLTALKFLLENASERIRAGDDAGEALGSVIGRMRGAVEEVRRISMDLRPSTLDALGILPTIGWFCREFQEACPDIRVERQVDVMEEAIPEALKITVYRLLQEAMNNAAKHSGATKIQVRLDGAGSGLRLRIEDNGRGFPENPAENERGEPGFGLRSMRQRAELTGGTLSLLSPSSGGAAVEVFWPPEALRRLQESVS